ncbi:hypothetical protein G6F68_017167 [Rhizopus microsporus]|nr:hypothetical protein G6F68_017167 [Rhizopus microsporus]
MYSLAQRREAPARAVRFRRHGDGTAVPGPGTAGAAEHRRFHLPAGVDAVAGLAAGAAPPRGPLGHAPAVPHGRFPVADLLRAGDPGADLRPAAE